MNYSVSDPEVARQYICNNYDVFRSPYTSEHILNSLNACRDEIENIKPETELYEVEPEEWVESYDDLCTVYEEAASQGKGLMFTF